GARRADAGPGRAPEPAPTLPGRRSRVRSRRRRGRRLHRAGRAVHERLRPPRARGRRAAALPDGQRAGRPRPAAERRWLPAGSRAGGAQPARGLRGAAGRAGRAGSRLHGDRPARRAGLGPRRRRGSPAASRRPAAARDGAPAAHADVRARGGRVMAHRAGIVAIVGRPNVGKSTLLNALVGAQVAIVTPKPQTTRTRVVGIRTLPGAQAVFVDTPGIHDARSTLNRRMVETARRVLEEADAALLVLDASAGVVAGDRTLAAELGATPLPTIVVL